MNGIKFGHKQIHEEQNLQNSPYKYVHGQEEITPW